MIKKLLFSFLVLFSLSNLANAQAVVVTESFDNNPFVPTGWALKPATPQPLWVRSTTSTFPTVTPHSGNAMARFRSRSAIAGLTQQLVTKAIDYSNRGNTATSVSFWIYRDDINANFDSITVYVNNTDSMDVNAVKIGTVARSRTYMIPDTQAVNGWYNYSFAIPTSFTGNMTTHIIFQGNCENILGANQGANTTIDDVSYEEFPMPCSGSPNVGNIVNTTPLICGGSGTSNLSLSTPITGAGITYTWQMSNSFTGPWTIFAGNSATVTTGNLSSKTFIKCIVSCANSGLSYTTNTDSIQVSTNPLPLVLVSPSTAAVCNGATSGAILAATGAVSYTWSPALGLNTTSGNVVTASPTAATQYTVTGIDSIGCSATATVNVTLANAPILTMTATPSTSVCAGSTVILNPIQGGGPGANNNTYIWSNGVTTRRDTITVTADTTLTVIVTNQAGCSSTDSISITALPAQNSNFGYSYIGNTYSFIDSTTGSTAWSWNFGDGNTSMNQNPTYTFSAPGTYTVTMIVVGPCKTDTISKTILVFPLGMNEINTRALVSVYPNPTSNELNVVSSLDNIEAIKISNVFGAIVKEIKLNTTAKSTTVSVKELPSGMYTIQLNAGKKLSTFKFNKL
jgi:PKD repeat protein